MVYSEALADRVRGLLRRRRRITEKKMFGGMGFLWRDHLCVGIWKHSLIARLGPEQAEAALRQPHVRPFDVTGRPMKGWVMIEPEGLDTDEQLADWIERSCEFVETLPIK